MIYFFLYITFEQYHRCHQILLCVHIDCDIKGEEVILRKTLKKKWSHKCAGVEHQTPKTNHPIHLIHFKLHNQMFGTHPCMKLLEINKCDIFLIHCKLAKVQIHTLFLKTKYEVKDI